MADRRKWLDTAEVIALFQAGHDPDEIAGRFDVRRNSIVRALRRNGIRVQRAGRLTKMRLYLASNEAFCVEEIAKVKHGNHSPEVIAMRVAVRQSEYEEALKLRAPDRTPCSYCGVRADVGCRHNRWAA